MQLIQSKLSINYDFSFFLIWNKLYKFINLIEALSLFSFFSELCGLKNTKQKQVILRKK